MRKKAFDVFVDNPIERREPIKVDFEYERESKKSPHQEKSFSWLLSLIFTGLLLLLGYFLWDIKAEVLITPELEKFQYEGEVRVYKDQVEPDWNNWIIPLAVLENTTEYSNDFPAVETDLSESASGKLTIYNDSNAPVSLATGTQFVSGDGKIFKIVSRASVPAAQKDGGKLVSGTSEVLAVSAQAGPDFNIDPATFSVPKLKSTPLYQKIYAKSFEKMQGGKTGKGLKAMPDDIERAHSYMGKDSFNKSKEELAKKFEAYYIFDSSLKQEIVSTSSQVSDNPFEKTFNYKMQVKTTAWAVKKKDLQDFALKSLEAQKPADKTLFNKDFNYYVLAHRLDASNNQVLVRVSSFTSAYFNLNQDPLRQEIAGKSWDVAEDIVKTFYPGKIKEMELKMLLPIKKELPQDMQNISIRLIGVE